MNYFNIFIFFAFLFYTFFVIYFIIGIIILKNKTTENINQKVSVVVAARNEEKNISNCINSILESDYPKDLFEIIIVDDNSTDDTYKIIESFSKNNPNVKPLKSPTNATLIGKSNAIDFGISNANGDLILMTDADCIVNKFWIKNIVKHFKDDVGLVAGLTILKVDSIFSGFQSLDWTFLLGIGAAGISLKNPFSVIGNNLSVRKKVYEEIGGYKNLKFSVTEDFMLFKKISETTKWKYAFPLSNETLVTSQPCENISSLIKQKKRWGIGGTDMKLSGLLIMVAGFLIHFAFLMIPFYSNNIILHFSFFITKIFFDFIFLYLILKKVNQVKILKYFFFFEIYYIIYVLVLPFFVFFTGKLDWKGRKY